MNNATRNWKTSLTGVLILAAVAIGIWKNPNSATDPATLAEITAGAGLILAKDGDKTGTIGYPAGSSAAAIAPAIAGSFGPADSSPAPSSGGLSGGGGSGGIAQQPGFKPFE